MIRNEAVNGKSGLLSGGNMLFYTVDTEISEIRAGGFTNPPILSLVPDFASEYSHTDVKRDGARYLRDVFSHRYEHTENGEKISDIFISARMCDRALPYGAFVRDVETVRPIEMKISLPPYVRRSFIKNYKIGSKRRDALCLVLPAGVGFYKCETSVRDVKLIIVLGGDAEFSENGETVRLSCGTSRIAFASGEGEECIKNVLRALKEETSFVKDAHEETLSEKLLNILLSHQSESGGIIASRSEPIVRMDSVQTLVGALIKHSKYENARKTLEFFCKRFDADGRFYQIYSAENRQSERYFSDVSLGCARLMGAMLDYARASGDNSLIKENIKMMRSAMYMQFDACSDSTMPFSGAETELSDSLVNVRSREYASLEATLSFATATLDFCDYCEENSIKLPHDNGSAKRRAEAILKVLADNFIVDGVPSLSSSEGKIKLPRFTYGDCDICSRKFSHIYYGELELTERNTYACPRCLCEGDSTPIQDETQRGFSVLAAALLLENERFCEVYGEDRSRELLKRTLDARRSRSDMTSVRADALLLIAARRFGENTEFLEREIILEAEKGKLINECFDTRTAASALLAI